MSQSNSAIAIVLATFQAWIKSDQGVDDDTALLEGIQKAQETEAAQQAEITALQLIVNGDAGNGGALGLQEQIDALREAVHGSPDYAGLANRVQALEQAVSGEDAQNAADAEAAASVSTSIADVSSSISASVVELSSSLAEVSTSTSASIASSIADTSTSVAEISSSISSSLADLSTSTTDVSSSVADDPGVV